MAVTSLRLEKQFTLQRMDFSGNPNKKLRLDSSRNINTGNEDLWGQDDMTAEEFDMLETQATQSMNKESIFLNSSHHHVNNNRPNCVNNLQENESVKQLRYELEGRIKLLSHSLEKASKELNEERLSKATIISEKFEEYQKQENNLRKDIEKLQSVLQFKDQEMKNVYSKIHVLEAQLQTRNNKQIDTTMNRKSDEFAKKFNFESNLPGQSAQITSQKTQTKFQRKHKLSLDSPQGNIHGVDVISSVLCNRLISCSNLNDISPEDCSKKSFPLSAISVARLRYEQESEEFFEYYESLLKDYFEHLQNVSCKHTVVKCNKASPLRHKDTDNKQAKVIACLKEVIYILSSQQSASLIQKSVSGYQNALGNKMPSLQKFDSHVEESSIAVFVPLNERMDISSSSFPHLVASLLALTNPNTYPDGYSKNGEVELSLTALLSLSSLHPEILIKYLDELPVSLLINNEHSITCLCLTLKLLVNICHYKEFCEELIHKNDKCLMCAVATLMLHTVSVSPLEFASVMLMVEDFLSIIFTVHSLSQVKLEPKICIVEILKGVITSLWKFLNIKDQGLYITLVLKKGFSLLHLLSCCIPDFKECRNAVEGYYISLVCGMLTLSKEDPEFKDSYDFIHNLWDFQDDVSELDLDDLSDENLTVMDDE